MKRFPVSRFVSLAVLCLLPSFASAVTRTWNGADPSGVWSDGDNWGGTAPSATGDSLVFGGSTHLTDNSNDLSLSIGSLSFATGAGAFVLSGNSVTITNAAAITNSSSNLQTIDNNIVLGLASGIQTIAGSANGIVVNGAISGSSAVALRVTGIVTLAGSNTHAGGTTLATGNTLNINNAQALGSGTFTVGGGLFNNTSGSALILNNNAQTWSGDLSFVGANSLNLGTGAVSTGAGGSRSLAVSGSTLTVGGVIADGVASTSLSKSGDGTLVLSGANAFSGGFSLAGNGVVSIGHKSALGSGTVSFATSNGSISASTNLTGTNSVANNLLFTAATNRISGTNDLTLTGNVTSTATANRTFNYSGTGVLTLAGINSYNGSTTVSGGGTLLIDGSHTGGGLYTISSGRLGGGGSITLTNLGITIASGAKLAPGNSAQTDGTFSIDLGTGTLNLSAAVGGANTGALLFDLGAVGAANTDLLTLSGTLSIGATALEFADFNFTTLSGFNAGTYVLMDASSHTGSLGSSLSGTIGGYNGVISLDSPNSNIVLTVTAVPEPSSAAAFLAGTVLVFGTRRRRSLLSQ